MIREVIQVGSTFSRDRTEKVWDKFMPTDRVALSTFITD